MSLSEDSDIDLASPVTDLYALFQRSFTLTIEAWDWDNETKAGEYILKEFELSELTVMRK